MVSKINATRDRKTRKKRGGLKLKIPPLITIPHETTHKTQQKIYKVKGKNTRTKKPQLGGRKSKKTKRTSKSLLTILRMIGRRAIKTRAFRKRRKRKWRWILNRY